MKLNWPITIVLMIVVASAGLGVGYLAGTSGAHTTGSYSLSTVTTTNTSNLVNYWAQAYSATPWTYFQLSRSQLVPLLNAGNTSIYIIDVRQTSGTAGYSSGHIAGAHNIPFPEHVSRC